MADSDDSRGGGLSGTASAFGRGWDAAGGKQAKQPKPKQPKEKKSKKPAGNSSPDVDPSAQKKQGGSGLLGAIKKSVGSFKRGGRVPRTGLALLHKGEYVVPAKRSKHKARSKRTIIKH